MDFKNKYVLASGAFIIIGIIVYLLSDIVFYIIAAWVISMIGAPLTIFLRRYIGKNLSAILTLSIFVFFFALLLYTFIPPLVQQARNLATIDYESVINSFEEPINDWERWLIDKGLMEGNKDSGELKNPTDSIQETKPLVISKTVKLDSLISSGGDTLIHTNISLVINIQNPDFKNNSLQDKTRVEITDSFFDRVRKNLFKVINPARISILFSTMVGWVGNTIIAILSILFISFFFLREQGLFSSAISSLVPEKYEIQTGEAVSQSSKLLIRYFTGVVIQITVITVYVSVVLSILGIKNALLIGFFAAVMNVIPYLGPILGATFGVIITLTSNLDIPFYNEMLPMLFKVILVFASMQLIDNFILQPNIFSKSVKAHPLEIFIVILTGAKLAGIIGMVLAIPIYTVFRVVGKVFLSEFKIIQTITRRL
ncbi:MAG TPA: AI-2E family transporter [Saprospiraceae bacterium]|nr:AI-2E family transporter [Saprospiraceae bacterium]